MNLYREDSTCSEWRDGYSLSDDDRERVLKSVKIQKMIGIGVGVVYCAASINYAVEIALVYGSYFYLISVFLFGGCGVVSYIKGHRRETALETGDFRWKTDTFRRFSMIGKSCTRIIGKSGNYYHPGNTIYRFRKDVPIVVIDYSGGCGAYFADRLPTAYTGDTHK